VQSSLQQRAYESWLRIVSSGKITVQMPGSLTNNLVTYTTTPGSPWTVPAGVTSVVITCVGGSGGGGGALWFTFGGATDGQRGGRAGYSGKAISIVSVVESQELYIVVGAAGVGGASWSGVFLDIFSNQTATGGGDGATSSVTIDSDVVCQGDGSDGGGPSSYVTASPPGTNYYTRITAGANSADASGAGNAVTVGGGRQGGAPGEVLGAAAAPGSDGYVTIAW